jgi:hypothetical protein
LARAGEREVILDFFIKHGFVTEMLAASALFLISLKRRRLFAIRLIAVTGALFGISLLWNHIFEANATTEMAKYTLMFAAFTGVVMLCFNTTFSAALFCETGAYTTQHFAFKIGAVLKKSLFTQENNLYSAMLYIAIDILTYGISYLLFARRIARDEAKHLENKQVIFLSVALILFTTAFQFIFEAHVDSADLLASWIVAFYDMLCCILILCIQYGMFKSSKMQEDYIKMEHILHLQKKQLQTSKDNIDVINIKCHDLKHQISQLGDRISPNELEQLKQAITIYDSMPDTGNEAIDVILAEKSLLCQKNNIRLLRVVDGKKLDFMSASDIYSLFGNAIDNSIEAVNAFEDKDKRVISLTVREFMGMLSIHFENYYRGELFFDDGLPLTTKRDKRYHGFGMKSIKLLVEKYKGNLTVMTKNGVFNLNILFPLNQNAV